MIRILMIVCFVSGCSSMQPCESIDLEFKAGYWQNDGRILGSSPGIVDIDCQVASTVFTDHDSINFGFVHQSDIFLGTPFNDKKEIRTNMWTIGYKVNLYSSVP